MSFVKTGGFRWSVDLVGWGSPGAARNRELHGYWNKGFGKGKPSKKTVKNATANVWSIQAVYALYSGTELVYIGEGQLGSRLLQHYRSDDLAGRWDCFTWLSPWEYQRDGKSATMQKWDPKVPVSMKGKQLVELLELVSIRLALPSDNRQQPEAKKSIKWLKQIRSKYAAGTLEDKVNELSDKLDRLLKD